MSIEVRVPQLPESVADATLVSWHKSPATPSRATKISSIWRPTRSCSRCRRRPACIIARDQSRQRRDRDQRPIDGGHRGGRGAAKSAGHHAKAGAAPKAEAATAARRKAGGQAQSGREARRRREQGRSGGGDRFGPRRPRLEVRRRQLPREQGRGAGEAGGTRGRRAASASNAARAAPPPARARRARRAARADDAIARAHRRAHGAGTVDAGAVDLIQRSRFEGRQRAARALQGSIREAARREARLHVVFHEGLRRGAEEIPRRQRLGRRQRHRLSRVLRRRRRGLDRPRTDRAGASRCGSARLCRHRKIDRGFRIASPRRFDHDRRADRRHVHDHQRRSVRIAVVDADRQFAAERDSGHAQDPRPSRGRRRTNRRSADDVRRVDLRSSHHRRS
jgi:hypothetical protein